MIKKISTGILSAAIILIGTISINQVSAKRNLSAIRQSSWVKNLEADVFTPTETQGIYKVVNVADGGTIDVSIDNKIERVRLAGADTPEIVAAFRAADCYGKEAAAKTTEMLLNKYVALETDGETDGARSDDNLRYVFLPDNINFNKYMISEGYARRYTDDQQNRYSKEFKAAEEDAKKLKKGLWGACQSSDEMNNGGTDGI